jgi:hypothetical protein
MFALDLFNTDHERRLAEGAVDQLEQRRIDDLAMKMDDLVARARQATTPEAKAALIKEFQKCKAERDSYYKIRNETMGYGTLVGEDNVNEGSYKDMLWKLAERMDRAQFIDHCTSELGQDANEMGEFWDSINGPLDEAGIPGNVPTEKIPGKEDLLKGKGRGYYEEGADEKFSSDRIALFGKINRVIQSIQTPEQYANALGFVKRAFQKLNDQPGGPEFSSKTIQRIQQDARALNNDLAAKARELGIAPEKFLEAGIPGSVPTEKIPSKKVFKDKAGNPVGEIGIDPESSPGNSEWYVYHYGTGYSVVGFDNAAEAKRELMYVHKHPEAVEGHESTFDEAGIPGNVPVEKIPGKEDLLKGKGRSYYESTQKKNSEITDPAQDRLLTKARRAHPKAHSDAEALAMRILDKEQEDVSRLDHVNDREDKMIDRLANLEMSLQSQIDQLKGHQEVDEAGGGWALDPKTKLELKKRKDRQKTIAKWAGKPVPPQDPKEKEINEAQQLHVGDPIVVTAPNEFEGKTGEIYDFSPSGSFVIVDLYNHGKHSMHLSDVEYNDYADQEEEDDWYDNEVEEGFQDFNKVEPYEVCLAGKPVKTFDYYEDARRFHDNWKKKLYNQGEQAKADKITLNPIMKEELAGEPRSSDDISRQQKAMQRTVSTSTDDVKSFASQGYTIKFKPDVAEIYYGSNLVYSKPGNYSNPTKQQLSNLRARITDLVSRKKVAEVGNPAQQAAIAIAKKKEHDVNEESSTSGESAERAILNRIMVAHTDLLAKFGPQKVMQAVEEVAYNIGDLSEIGTSDVSAWVNEVKRILGA